MRTHNGHRPAGQVLIHTTLVMVVLLAILALAIDAGYVRGAPKIAERGRVVGGLARGIVLQSPPRGRGCERCPR